MSLITLTSELNVGDPRNQSAAYMMNNFKDGITFNVGDTISLVSLTINKQDRYEVVQGSSDTLIWRIGDRVNFSQHTVVVPQGGYTGTELAQVLQTALNNSTLLGNYQKQLDGAVQVAGWTVVYDQNGSLAHPTFTIDITQQETPSITGGGATVNPISTYAGWAGSFTIAANNTTNITTLTSSVSSSNQMDTGNLGSWVYAGQRGIFPNGGTIVSDVECITGMDVDLGSFQQLIGVAPADTMTMYDYATPLNNAKGHFEAASGTAAANNWDMVFIFDGANPDIYWRIYTGAEENKTGINNGSFRVGTDENNDGTNPASWDYVNPVWYFNETGGTLQTQTREEGGTYDFDIERDDAQPITNSMNFPVGYSSQRMGFMRNQLYTGPTKYPGDANAVANARETDGADINFQIINNPTNQAAARFVIWKMTQQPGTVFPNAGWRNGQVIMDITSDAFDTLPNIGNSPPANWVNFDIANGPNVRMKIQIDAVRNMTFSVSHDTDGTGTFTEYRDIRKTSTAVGSTFFSSIQEKFYPLRPWITGGKGGWYEGTTMTTKGKSDRAEYVNNLGGVMSSQLDTYTQEEIDLAAQEHDAAPIGGLGADPANALTLSQMWKVGNVEPSDVGTGVGQLPAADLNPNIANINTLIGMNPFYVFASGSAHNPLISTNVPFTSILEPSLSVELQDFNQRGHNGFTGDRTKAIAIIPKEELMTGESQGVLHYYAQFPIDIDLQVPQEQTLYSLTASLRLKDGTLANDLLNPSEMTLLHKEGEESKQVRIMEKALARIAGYKSDIQQNQISTMGNQFPRV
ncbi:MAG: hypothetical protein H8E55_24235 [Pelagibacterales bacterium]|nr:hypothetical protein [Pelagibacterales bacterium]